MRTLRVTTLGDAQPCRSHREHRSLFPIHTSEARSDVGDRFAIEIEPARVRGVNDDRTHVARAVARLAVGRSMKCPTRCSRSDCSATACASIRPGTPCTHLAMPRSFAAGHHDTRSPCARRGCRTPAAHRHRHGRAAGRGIRGACRRRRSVPGQRLITFDLRRIARQAKSLITPIVVTNADAFELDATRSIAKSRSAIAIGVLDEPRQPIAAAAIRTGESRSRTRRRRARAWYPRTTRRNHSEGGQRTRCRVAAAR